MLHSTDMEPYRRPLVSAHLEREIKKSRFIVDLARAATPDDALAFVAAVRARHAKANHHCPAWIAGPPADLHCRGCSDDGEPSGTAGRPMLTVLDHAGVGEVAAVVTRYFGGIKLGTGGLVRAYSGTVREGLDILETELVIPATPLVCVIPYPLEDTVRRLLQRENIPVTDAVYAVHVTLTLAVPDGAAETLRQTLVTVTAGAVTFEK